MSKNKQYWAKNILTDSLVIGLLYWGTLDPGGAAITAAQIVLWPISGMAILAAIYVPEAFASRRPSGFVVWHYLTTAIIIALCVQNGLPALTATYFIAVVLCETRRWEHS